MNSTIKIATLPLNITWCDCEQNLLTVAEHLSKLQPDTDILVLPELFTTGFIKDEDLLKKTASASEPMTLAALHLWSSRLNIAIAGSYLASIGNKVVNRGFFIEPSGEETFYDKHHLFCLSVESKTFAAGDKLPPVIRFRGWNISMIVCYDLRFPVWCRNQNEKYDIFIVPANWPIAREYAWRHLLIARAIENQAIVIGANRSGEDDFGQYDGLSYIFDPFGKEMASSGSENSNPNDFIYATYTHDKLDKVRTVLPVGKDADAFELKF